MQVRDTAVDGLDWTERQERAGRESWPEGRPSLWDEAASRRESVSLAHCCPECGPGPTSITIIWEFVKQAESQAQGLNQGLHLCNN